MMYANSRLTLRHADRNDKVIWVAETHDSARLRTEIAQKNGTFVTLNRIVNGDETQFSTQPENVMNIEAI
jgi:hypothetical protein